jgi:hypothetical protein
VRTADATRRGQHHRRGAERSTAVAVPFSCGAAYAARSKRERATTSDACIRGARSRARAVRPIAGYQTKAATRPRLATRIHRMIQRVFRLLLAMRQVGPAHQTCDRSVTCGILVQFADISCGRSREIVLASAALSP